ncbi:MAG: AMP-binding protein [Bacteroidia bacterium]|nr:AMP-binding protein [Bacteroidia bacterium]
MATLTKTKETVDTLTTSLEKFYRCESKLADKVFLHQPIAGQWYTWTYKQAGQEIRKMAAYLKENFSPGAKIALLSRNCAHWIMADLAINMAGCINVPLYPNTNRGTVSYVLDHSESEALLVGKMLDSDWQEMRNGVPENLATIKMGGYGLDADYKTWESICETQAPLEESPKGDINGDQTIIYTSGTTGKPKGVVIGASSLSFSIAQFDLIFDLNENDRFFSYLPLSHIAERMLITQGVLIGGSSIHFAESLDTFADNLKYARPTIFLAVPRIWTKFQMGVLAKFPPSRLKLLTSLPILGNVIKKKIKEALGLDAARVTLTGAAPMPVSMLEWYKKLGIQIFDVYGMTENSALSHANRPGNCKFGTVGKVMLGVEMKLTEDGEICVKSPANMKGYYKMPEKTADTLKDGWLHTGDKGVIDSEGYVKITGRVKDLFKTSKAKYVAPNPIEQKLSANPFIEQVCVVGNGIPQPIALVVLSEAAGEKEQEEVKESLAETLKDVNATLEHHEILQKIVVMKEDWTVENGVLTPTLKIKRNEVDQRFESDYENWYAGGKGVVYQ